MNPDFQRAHEFTAAWEGGYVNHKADPGGETNLGVTRRVWEAWCREKNLPVKPMKALTLADVLPLYEARYWSEVAHLPWPLSGVAYDYVQSACCNGLDDDLCCHIYHVNAHDIASPISFP